MSSLRTRTGWSSIVAIALAMAAPLIAAAEDAADAKINMQQEADEDGAQTLQSKPQAE